MALRYERINKHQLELSLGGGLLGLSGAGSVKAGDVRDLVRKLDELKVPDEELLRFGKSTGLLGDSYTLRLDVPDTEAADLRARFAELMNLPGDWDIDTMRVWRCPVEGCAHCIGYQDSDEERTELDALTAHHAQLHAPAEQAAAEPTPPSLPEGLEFPGDEIAQRLPDGGWGIREGVAFDDRFPPDPDPGNAWPSCMQNLGDVITLCTGEIDGWHVSACSGRVNAVWREPNGGRATETVVAS